MQRLKEEIPPGRLYMRMGVSASSPQAWNKTGPLPLMPLLAPAAWRDMFRRLLALSDGQIRFVGLSLVGGGLLVGLLMA